MARTGIDFLSFAVYKLGGATLAARQLGVSKADVAAWLRNGAASAPYGVMIKFASRVNCSTDLFRLGPPRKCDAAYAERAASS